MSAAGLSIAITNSASASALSMGIDIRAIPPTLIRREATPRRTKIWDFSTHLHCSIIGTCLSTGELRQVLRKFGLASAECTDHDLHGTAVTLAARHDEAARQLHKALDRRHKLAVSQFDKAATEDELRAHVAGRGAARRYPGRLLGDTDASAHQPDDHPRSLR